MSAYVYVGLCVTRDTPGNVGDCGIECFDAGISCSASSPDCYRLNRNQVPNCQPPPPFTCYILNDPCLPVDTGDVWLTIEHSLVIDPGDDPLRTLISSGPFPNFTISCNDDADCDSGSVCSIDSCSGGSCQHDPSGVTTCDDGVYCTETDQCSGGKCIGEGDTCESIFLCDETADECFSCGGDNDCDDVRDGSDNCVGTPNGPDGGVCISGSIGEPCLEHCDCGVSVGYCSMTQEDSYPPQGNNCGDACECEGNFDNDDDQDGSDAAEFKSLCFGRSSFNRPCVNEDPCSGDFTCDGDCDGSDAAKFKEDFGRSLFLNPCPYCPTDPWCDYHG